MLFIRRASIIDESDLRKKRMGKKIVKYVGMVIPVYAWIPLSAALLINYFSYFLSKMITAGRHHYNMWTVIDDHIPFLPCFVIIYVLAFVQWVIGYVLIARESRPFCYQVIRAEVIAKVICLACFLLIPTIIVRPQVEGNGFCEWLTQIVYDYDAPTNLFPSIHCLESWFCFRAGRKLTKVPGWYGWVSLVMTLLVFASTVCLKQHVFVDIPAAIAAAEIGLAISPFQRKTV